MEPRLYKFKRGQQVTIKQQDWRGQLVPVGLGVVLECGELPNGTPMFRVRRSGYDTIWYFENELEVWDAADDHSVH